jgi:hypothetical protein
LRKNSPPSWRTGVWRKKPLLKTAAFAMDQPFFEKEANQRTISGWQIVSQ